MENRPQRIASIGRQARAPSWGGRLGSIPDTDDGDEDEEAMDFSDAASGGEESSGGGGTAGGAFPGSGGPPPPPRRSSLPTLAEDSVGGGSRSTRTRSPSPSVGTLAGGGGSRTASGVEGGSAGGAFGWPPQQQQREQHPSSSGERERGAGDRGGGDRGGGAAAFAGGGIAGGGGGNNNAPTPPPPPYYYSHPSHRNFSLSPLSHSGRWDSYFDSKRKVNVPGRGKFCVYQRGGVAAKNGSNNSASSSAFAAAAANANNSNSNNNDTAVSPAPLEQQLPVVFCHHGAGYTGLSWALMAAQMGPGIRVVAYDARGHGETETLDDADLSAATQAGDAAALWRTLFAEEIAMGKPPKTIAVGHAMGGMACTRAAAEHQGYRGGDAETPNANGGGLVGIALIDVVLWHGGAAESGPHMLSVVAGRPPTFDSHAAAMQYATSSGRCRNPEAVAVSFASMVREVTDEEGTRWVWRTPLAPSRPFWAGWYDGLAQCLLSPALSAGSGGVARLLMFSSATVASRPLDRSLEVARAQGKLQVLELPLAAFAVHEDEPVAVASALRDFLEYNTRDKGGLGGGGGGGGGEASSRTLFADGS